MTSYGSRRVPGLRRNEVAQLAGVSIEYYSRLERGNLTGVSDSVLDAIARALQLDEAECTHLHDLARASGPAARKRRPPAPQGVRANVRRLLDAMTDVPAVVMNGRTDALAANQLGRALFAPIYAGSTRPPNFARFTFLDPGARGFWTDWDHIADDTVELLRAQAGRDPYDKALTDLIGELATRNEDFPHPVDRTRRTPPPHRNQAPPPPDHRRAAADLRSDGTGRGRRPEPGRLRHRTGHLLRRRTAPARQLVGNTRSRPRTELISRPRRAEVARPPYLAMTISSRYHRTRDQQVWVRLMTRWGHSIF